MIPDDVGSKIIPSGLLGFFPGVALWHAISTGNVDFLNRISDTLIAVAVHAGGSVGSIALAAMSNAK
jgi:membrane associated rhomboid family serine protease